MADRVCGNCRCFDDDAYECAWHDEGCSGDKHVPTDPACELWEEYEDAKPIGVQSLVGSAKCVKRQLETLMDDDVVKQMPMLYLSLEKMRDLLSLGLEACDGE